MARTQLIPWCESIEVRDNLDPVFTRLSSSEPYDDENWIYVPERALQPTETLPLLSGTIGRLTYASSAGHKIGDTAVQIGGWIFFTELPVYFQKTSCPIPWRLSALTGHHHRKFDVRMFDKIAEGFMNSRSVLPAVCCLLAYLQHGQDTCMYTWIQVEATSEFLAPLPVDVDLLRTEVLLMSDAIRTVTDPDYILRRKDTQMANGDDVRERYRHVGFDADYARTQLGDNLKGLPWYVRSARARRNTEKYGAFGVHPAAIEMESRPREPRYFK